MIASGRQECLGFQFYIEEPRSHAWPCRICPLIHEYNCFSPILLPYWWTSFFRVTRKNLTMHLFKIGQLQLILFFKDLIVLYFASRALHDRALLLFTQLLGSGSRLPVYKMCLKTFLYDKTLSNPFSYAAIGCRGTSHDALSTFSFFCLYKNSSLSVYMSFSFLLHFPGLVLRCSLSPLSFPLHPQMEVFLL